MGVSMVLYYLLVPVLNPYTDVLGFPYDKWVLVFVLVLPTLTYRFVTTIWMLALATSVARGRFG